MRTAFIDVEFASGQHATKLFCLHFAVEQLVEGAMSADDHEMERVRQALLSRDAMRDSVSILLELIPSLEAS